ncbi:hypothetical protein JTE90_026222, partial [Oedothorax gibbosus]
MPLEVPYQFSKSPFLLEASQLGQIFCRLVRNSSSFSFLKPLLLLDGRGLHFLLNHCFFW